MDIAPILGLLGDAFTLAGGLSLAWDTIEKEKEVRKIKDISKTIGKPGFDKLNIELYGEIVKTEDDVHRAFIRRTAKKAVWGCILLVMGFILLLAAHSIELLNPMLSTK